jgi:hypothetical protein
MTFARASTFHRRPSMTRKKASCALDRLLMNCRPEMLATFTAEGLAKTHNITVDKAARKLAAAIQDRFP